MTNENSADNSESDYKKYSPQMAFLYIILPEYNGKEVKVITVDKRGLLNAVSGVVDMDLIKTNVVEYESNRRIPYIMLKISGEIPAPLFLDSKNTVRLDKICDLEGNLIYQNPFTLSSESEQPADRKDEPQ